MKRYLYPPELLPDGFIYPESFLAEIEEDSLERLRPWYFVCEFAKEKADGWLAIIRRRYPRRILVPFARWTGSDDFVCFDGSVVSRDPIVYWVHANADSPYEHRGALLNFTAWLKMAREQAEEWRQEDAEYERKGRSEPT